tara:strand:- start:1075 stop:1239 length:165 start_codon:yes stop_codon:yes gene_type:complete
VLVTLDFASTAASLAASSAICSSTVSPPAVFYKKAFLGPLKGSFVFTLDTCDKQ